MKNLTKLIVLLFCMTCTTGKSQMPNFTCTVGSPYSAKTTTSQPAGCSQFLENFVPLTTDSTVEVNVTFWVFAPAGAGVSSPWDSNTVASPALMDACLAQLNTIFSSVTPPTATVGTSYISNAKIKFVRKDFFSANYQTNPVITVSDMKNNYNYANFFTGAMNTNYRDPHSINVYFGGSSAYTGAAAYRDDKRVFINAASSGNSIMNPIIALAHEFAHILGVSHTTIGESTRIQPPNGCCVDIQANDYLIDILPLSAYNCSITGNSTISNNLMTQNAYCNQYISRLQMATMHYHLRTDQNDLLTSNSYNNHISRNAAADYSVTTDESFMNDRYFKGNIRVLSGRRLHIYCLVGMAKGTKIVVEKGASLTVEQGTVTNISGQMWNGIEVEGVNALDQQINTSTGLANQGLLYVQYDAEISNAYNGALNYLTEDSGEIIWGSVGGIIRGNYGIFLNNRRDVEFLNHSAYPSASKFEFCQFKTTDQLNDAQFPFAHVSLWGLRGVSFKGCNFEYAAGGAYTWNNRGMGILSIDANYLVDNICIQATSVPNINLVSSKSFSGAFSV